MRKYKWETNRLPNGEWEVIDVKEVIGEYKTYSTVVRGATKEQCEKIARLHNAAVQAAREMLVYADTTSEADVAILKAGETSRG